MADARPRALVLTGQGINCDHETRWALKVAGANAERRHINDIIAGKYNLRNYQMLFFPGGFSYGDDISSGKVLAVLTKSHLKDSILEFIAAGKLIGGFCNGFQVMVKMGLLPGLDNDYSTQRVTLDNNDSKQYEDRWVHLVKPGLQGDRCIFTRGIDSLYVPVAHGEGKFYAPDGMIQRIEREGLVVFRYAMPDLEVAGGRYPHNPNGSINDIVGICDPTGRVFGMMPHPERFLHFTNHPTWTREKETLKGLGLPLPEEGEGMQIFRNAVEYFK